MNSTSKDRKPPATPMSIAEVRRGFSDARRRALSTQGKVTFQRVLANQATMKSLP